MATKLTTILDQLASGIGIGVSGGSGTYITGRLVVAPLYDGSLLSLSTTKVPCLSSTDRVVLSGANLSLIGSNALTSPYIHIYDRGDAGHTQFSSDGITRTQVPVDLTIEGFNAFVIESAKGSGTILEVRGDEALGYIEGAYIDLDNKFQLPLMGVDDFHDTETDTYITGTQVGGRLRFEADTSGRYVDLSLQTFETGTLRSAIKVQTSGNYVGVFHETPTFGVDVSGSGIRVVNPDGGASVFVMTSAGGYQYAVRVLDNGILYTQRIA